MKASSVLSSLALLAGSLVSASPTRCRAEKPAAFLLAGDSTTAVQSTGGGGWGTGFLATLTNGAVGTYDGHNGRTTVSFVDGGDWANVIADVKSKASKYDTYVTIQFGHNDQKAAANISVAQFTANLQNLGNQIILNLADQVAATIVAAKAIGAQYIDLNKGSVAYLEAIGLADATKYNLVEGDFTNLKRRGVWCLGTWTYTVEDKTIKAAIAAGKFILPSV
ncbi:hypothetical protein VE04_03159 [Pseudogymnoascus sp. 24MN13]|nr:hypothetical protein VE04_03159 [Pseudogymnoascus sp. 24MN13]